MEGDGVIYNVVKGAWMEGSVNMGGSSTGHVLKLALLTSYFPNIDTDHNWADVSVAEVTGTGYTAGGQALTGQNVAVVDANDLGKFDANDVTWAAINAGTPSAAVLYDDSHPSKVLIAAWVLSTPTNGGSYTIQWNAAGIITIT